MMAQLFSLFCFGLVVSFIVFLGVLRARDVKKREMAEQAVTAGPHMVASGRRG